VCGQPSGLLLCWQSVGLRLIESPVQKVYYFANTGLLVCWCVVWCGWPLLWPQRVLSVLAVSAVAGTGPLCVLLLSVQHSVMWGSCWGCCCWQPGLGVALVPRAFHAALHAASVVYHCYYYAGCCLSDNTTASDCVRALLRGGGVLRVWAAAAWRSVGLDFPSHNRALTVPKVILEGCWVILDSV
jgi:hypothetical protein